MRPAPPTPYGYTIFCDDIRQEVEGKLTIVGAYGHQMIIYDNLPFILPKFGLLVNYFERPSESEESVDILVYLPGDVEPSVVQRVEMEALRKAAGDSPMVPEKFRGPDSFDPLLPVRVVILMSPLHLTAEGPIRVRARRGTETYRMGTLLVTSKASMDAEFSAEPA
jgi:hypothetical protein